MFICATNTLDFLHKFGLFKLEKILLKFILYMLAAQTH